MFAGVVAYINGNMWNRLLFLWLVLMNDVNNWRHSNSWQDTREQQRTLIYDEWSWLMAEKLGSKKLCKTWASDPSINPDISRLVMCSMHVYALTSLLQWVSAARKITSIWPPNEIWLKSWHLNGSLQVYERANDCRRLDLELLKMRWVDDNWFRS